MSKKVIRKEVRYAVHLPRTDYREDAHYVKEQIFYDDGTSTPHSFLVKDFERPIYVTSQAHRNHKDKKEFEDVDKLMERKCTESDLNRVVAGMLGMPHLANQPNQIKNSPYLYGYDQTSTSIIKLKSLMKNNFIQSPYTVAAFDIETDIDTREILIATVVFGKKAHITILEKYLQGRGNVNEKIKAGIDKYLPQYSGKLDLKITVHETEVDMLTSVFKTANTWAPDFLSCWNINFDMPRVLERLKVAGVNPIDVVCDTTIPRQYRLCRYKEGIKNKTMASGKAKPISPSLQWHKFITTTTFHPIDSMCVYRQIRMAKQEEPSYALDAILQKVLGTRKLSFEEANEFKGAKWHIFMQQNYPIEYIVYNLYDCLGLLELDAVTKDLSQSLPAGAAMTDFVRFNSNPKKIVDALYIFGMERGRVVGTVPNLNKKEEEVDAAEIPDTDEGDEDDEEDGVEDPSKYKSLNLKGWIQLLPQNLLLAEGLQCLEDYPSVVTNVRGMVWDVDATAAYPTCTMVGNVSKETCVNELISIEGVDEEVFREQNLSMCLGGVNSLEYFTVMFGMPELNSEELDSLIGI